MGLAALQLVESSWTRDWNCVPCTGQQILNHWSTREVQLVVLFDPLNECDPSCLLFRIFLPWAFTSDRSSTQTLAIYPDSQIRGTMSNIFSLCRLTQAIVIVLWHQGHVILSPLCESCSPLFIPHLICHSFLLYHFLVLSRMALPPTCSQAFLLLCFLS